MAIGGTEHTVHNADIEILHQKLLSTPVRFQKSPKK